MQPSIGLNLLKTFTRKFYIIACITLVVFRVNAVQENNQLEPDSVLRTHQYFVSIDKKLHQAKVKICFDGKAPEYLMVDYKNATKSLIDFPKIDKGYIEFQGRYWMTKNLQDDACIEYKSDISSHLYKPKSNHRSANRISFQSKNTWLWLPEEFIPNETAEITFNLPINYQISTPWKLLRVDANQHHFKIGHTPHDWGFTLMIGEFEMRQIILRDNTQINLAISPNLKNKVLLQQWIIHSIKSLRNYLGVMPFDHLQVILLENKRFKSGPVPWGDVKRGGGIGVRFVVNSKRQIKAFYDDWTATHEFSHLLLPSIEYKDMWLSEGLASYLQYILMAQSGNISQEQAWQELYAGFLRGEKGTKKLPAETLLEASKNRGNGGRYGRTMRVYWSGAAYFFIADWQLRLKSNAEQSLPDVLLKLNQCCFNSSKEWSGKMLSEKLDQLSQTDIFKRLYQQIALSKDFPSTASTFKDLGIKFEGEEIKLLSGLNSQIRQSMIQSQ